VTDEQFIEWLKSQTAIRCALIEVDVLTSAGGSVETKYLSNRGYVTGPSDTPSNTVYSPIISGGISFKETLDISGGFSINSGDIELKNTNGGLDGWEDYFWNKRPIKVFIGDVSWPREDFRQIFSGVVAEIGIKSRTSFTLKIADKLQLLNTTVSEEKLGGTSSQADNLIPICLGEVFNVTPLLIDSNNQVYQVHNGRVESVIEVRDNGVPVVYAPNVMEGTFTLENNPVGTITCSVQGDYSDAYYNDAPNLIKRLVKAYGLAANRFSDSDIDLVNFSQMTEDNPQPCGVYLNDRDNVLSVCNTLAASIGCKLAVSKEGKLYLVKLSLPREDVGTTVRQEDIFEHTMFIESLPTVVAGVQIGYNKNYAVQNSLETGIPAEHIAMYAQEWLTSTATDSAASANYNLFTEPTMQESFLQNEYGAITEANRQLALLKVQRKVIQYQGRPHLMLTELGSTQTLVYPRYTLSGGKTGQVVSVSTDWLKCRVTVSVLI
jgi:hypothetical protein